MKLEHSFSVPVGIDDAWRILLDIERVAPCMPGAKLESFDGDELTGNVKVKLGAINLTYKGKASFVEKDETAHRAVIDARGRDARGNGTATARVTTSLTDDGGATTVMVNTDLDVTGKVAQFGRGVMVDVGNKLLGQFADCLAKQIKASDDSAAAAETTDSTNTTPAAEPEDAVTPTSAQPVVDDAALKVVANGADHAAAPTDAPPTANGHSAVADRETEPINLVESAGPAVAKRAALPLAALVLVVLLVVRRRRRRAAIPSRSRRRAAVRARH